MKTKHILIAVGIILVAAASSINVYLANNSAKRALSGMSLMNLEALTAGEIDQVEIDWSKLRLKKVGCKCKSTNKGGFTLRCAADGTLEKCSKTQQGSTACYKVSIFGDFLSLLCEGSDVETTE
jgi:hypothetical protein